MAILSITSACTGCTKREYRAGCIKMREASTASKTWISCSLAVAVTVIKHCSFFKIYLKNCKGNINIMHVS